MKRYDSSQTLPLLRTGLQPITAVDTLVDVLEGERPHARKAAVLLPLFVQDDVLHLVFIRRASTLRAHSGEIAFPGGSYDAEDISLVTTALREAFEEIGLLPASVEVLGLLPPVFTVTSNFLIAPVVGYLPAGLGPLQAQLSEVAEVLVLPLHAFADPAIAHTETWTRDGQPRTIYFYELGSLRIWGATGRILHSLLGCIEAGEETHKS
ncbi:MAG: NUDIX hydrolase [Ktedonobacteraceae bacterium]